ncbi:YdcF family protein [Leuconostoc rapi]|uniref:YdcF family protein n=1 Tax=Leuconostoc rapi TaxID=1406906 RepID=UPI00195EB489|nr:YdcF family protein [Leuconostoc rapi]MBM7435956.1 uncharacterized SAM-binding protein YcdF (DUF218 family) [Leuconostoc rapi]
METIILVLTIILILVALLHQVKQNPATMRIGTYGIFIVLGTFWSIMHVIHTTSESINVVLKYGFVIGTFFGVVLMLSMVRHSWKRSHDILLPLLVFGYFFSLIVGFNWPLWRLSAPWLMLYFVWQFIRFTVSSMVYKYVTKAPEKGPLVVLGGGLAAGYRVGNIVDQRIQAAVRDARQMSEYPTLIFSGGQGENQLVSEAEAMRDWAVLTYDVPRDHTMLENRSHNTYQNIKYTSQLLNGKPFTFYTSNYHVFRGVLLAQKQHIMARGRGGSVSLSYRIPAFFREFAGVMNINKRQQIIWGLIWLAIALIVNGIIIG